MSWEGQQRHDPRLQQKPTLPLERITKHAAGVPSPRALRGYVKSAGRLVLIGPFIQNLLAARFDVCSWVRNPDGWGAPSGRCDLHDVEPYSPSRRLDPVAWKTPHPGLPPQSGFPEDIISPRRHAAVQKAPTTSEVTSTVAIPAPAIITVAAGPTSARATTIVYDSSVSATHVKPPWSALRSPSTAAEGRPPYPPRPARVSVPVTVDTISPATCLSPVQLQARLQARSTPPPLPGAAPTLGVLALPFPRAEHLKTPAEVRTKDADFIKAHGGSLTSRRAELTSPTGNRLRRSGGEAPLTARGG